MTQEANFTIELPLEFIEEGDTVQVDRLVDAIITSLQADIQTLTRQVSILTDERDASRSRAGQLTADNMTLQGRISSAQATINELQQKLATSEEVESLKAAGLVLGERLALADAELERLRVECARLQGVEQRAGESADRAADLKARLIHAEQQVAALREEKLSLQRSLDEASKNLAAARDSVSTLQTELRRTADALARADKAKANALASQASSYEERIRSLQSAQAGVTTVDDGELAALRKELAEAKAVSRELEQLRARNRELEALQIEYEDKVIDMGRTLEDAKTTMARTDCLLREQHCMLTARRKELDFQTYLMHMLNGEPQIKTDSGQLAIFSLYPENIISSEGQSIHRDKPICWWSGYNGIGCLVMLSAEPDSTGQHYLVMPKMMFEQTDGQRVDVSKCMMPPESEWPLLVDIIMGMDRHKMLQAMKEGEAAAIVYASQRNPEAEKQWQEQLSAKAARESLDRMSKAVKSRRVSEDAKIAKFRKGGVKGSSPAAALARRYASGMKSGV